MGLGGTHMSALTTEVTLSCISQTPKTSLLAPWKRLLLATSPWITRQVTVPHAHYTTIPMAQAETPISYRAMEVCIVNTLSWRPQTDTWPPSDNTATRSKKWWAISIVNPSALTSCLPKKTILSRVNAQSGHLSWRSHCTSRVITSFISLRDSPPPKESTTRLSKITTQSTWSSAAKRLSQSGRESLRAVPSWKPMAESHFKSEDSYNINLFNLFVIK